MQNASAMQIEREVRMETLLHQMHIVVLRETLVRQTDDRQGGTVGEYILVSLCHIMDRTSRRNIGQEEFTIPYENCISLPPKITSMVRHDIHCINDYKLHMERLTEK